MRNKKSIANLEVEIVKIFTYHNKKRLLMRVVFKPALSLRAAALAALFLSF